MASSGLDILWKGTVVAIFVVFFSIIFHDLLTWIVFEQCDLSKFPLIYGVDGCNLFVNRSISLKFHFSSILFSLIGSKTIFYASVNKDESLIFKKLASKNELKSFDYENDYTTRTSVNFTLDKLIESNFIPFRSNATYKIRICPNKESVAKFIKVYNESAVQLSSEQLIPSLWALLQLNPEPLILTMLKPPDWPVPKYYGSCGRLAVFEHCGSRLTDLINIPYKERLTISHQILTAMLAFTFNHDDFSFYLTDISPDNIVVDDDGVVKFIDFENLILVEKIKKDMPAGWFEIHSSKHYDCMDCISISPDDICSHQTSDHNIYSVCKEIFSPSSLFPDGFLHSPPPDFLESQKISELLRNCVSPAEGLSRIEVAKELTNIMDVSLHRV